MRLPARGCIGYCSICREMRTTCRRRQGEEHRFRPARNKESTTLRRKVTVDPVRHRGSPTGISSALRTRLETFPEGVGHEGRCRKGYGGPHPRTRRTHRPVRPLSGRKVCDRERKTYRSSARSVFRWLIRSLTRRASCSERLKRCTYMLSGIALSVVLLASGLAIRACRASPWPLRNGGPRRRRRRAWAEVEGVAIADYRRILSERVAFGVLPAALSALLLTIDIASRRIGVLPAAKLTIL
jgi:hypothetical protein